MEKTASEPTLEDIRSDLEKIVGLAVDVEDSITNLHTILDNDLRAEVKGRALTEAEQKTPNLRFDMGRHAKLIREILEKALKELEEFRLKLRPPRPQAPNPS